MTAPPALRRAHRATLLAFFVFGIIMAAFGVHVPSLRAQYRLDDGTLAFALLGVAIGAVLCLALAGRLIAAFGARLVAAVSAVVLCTALALLLRFEQPAALAVLVVTLGAAVGLFDVAINTEGSFLEHALQRKAMSVLHGMWSLGGMAGALGGAWMTERGIAPATQLAWVAGVTLVLALMASAGMLSTHANEGETSDRHAARRMTPPARRRLVALGVLALLGLLGEGAIYDWSVLFLQRERGAGESLAAIGFACFSAAMAAGRFGGDWMRARVAAPRLLAASAALSAVAMAVVLLTPSVTVALIGLAFVGFGLANVVPILFVTASRIEGASPAAGIALVSSFGWIGVVAGPPLVGGVAQALSLSAGLALVVLAGAALAASARLVASDDVATRKVHGSAEESSR